MPRREREQSHGFDIAMQKASRLLGSPLNQIGKKLCDFLNDANRAFKARELDETTFSKLVSHVADTVDRLPQSFSERFQFDAALIKGIATDWGEDLALSSMIMPHHHSPWGHVRLPMPSENLNDAHVVDVIHMPGPDDLGEVDLLAYPWIIHEMGHYLLLRYSSNFVPVFKVELEGIVSNLRLASIADRGSASTKAHRILQIAKIRVHSARHTVDQGRCAAPDSNLRGLLQHRTPAQRHRLCDAARYACRATGRDPRGARSQARTSTSPAAATTGGRIACTFFEHNYNDLAR